MAFSVILAPAAINLSGNLNPLIISASSPVALRLQHNGKTIFENESYAPDQTDRITIELEHLVGDLISYTLPSVQAVATQASDSFKITVDDTTDIDFAVIKGGVDVENLDAGVFLRANWLTWQPQSVRTTYIQPQWLRYYADTAVNIRVKAYFEDQATREIVLSQIFAGMTTANVAYPVIAGRFDRQPQYYDVWVETLDGSRLSYIQRYIYGGESFNDDYFVFQNSLGGFDSARLTGEKTAASNMEATQFRAADTDSELRVDYREVFKKNTGYFDTDDKRKWILELFKSAQRYVVVDGIVRRIVISDPKLESKSLQANSFEFQYALARQKGYLNLGRTDELPEVLEISSADDLFFLEARLQEFPLADISKDTLIPVQHPHETTWRYLTLLTILSAISKLTADQLAEFISGNNFITEEWLRENYPLHTHKNKDSLDNVNFDFEKKRWNSIYDIVIKNILLQGGEGIDDKNTLSIKTKEGLDKAIVEAFKYVASQIAVKEAISSPDFVSGFPGGKGWAILLRDFINAAGVTEKKSYAEFDEVTVRGALRVFEMIVNQLRGENDNYIFSGMMKVERIDRAAKRIYLDTGGGLLYNTFRADDCLMCQRFGGMPTEENDYNVVKNYELVVTEAGVGDLVDGEKRLDWISYKNFTGDESVVEQGDILVRADNLTNPDRKGIMTNTTIGPFAPYQDVIYGMKTDPQNAVKARLGNLDGIITALWGQLKGYGLYSNNAYLLGDFRLRTGEDILTRFEVLEGHLRSAMQKVEKNVTEESNYLTNATFFNDLEGWEGENDIAVYSAGEDLLGLGMTYLSDKRKLAEVGSIDGRPALHILDSHVMQYQEDIRQPATEDTQLYLSLQYTCRRAGTLSIGFESTNPYIVGGLEIADIDIAPGENAVPYAASGTWDGQGHFVIRCTGEVYIEALTLTDRPLDEYRKEVSSLFEQTAESIRAAVREIDWINNKMQTAGWITTADGNKLWATLQQLEQVSSWFYELAADFNVTASEISGIVSRVDQIRDELFEQWTVIRQTYDDITLAVNRSTGFPIYKDFTFAGGANGLSAFNSSGGSAVTLKRLAIHRGGYVPTASNAPAIEWTSAAIRAQHVGDVFVNTDTGQRYTYTSGYAWSAGTPEFGAVPDDQPAVIRIQKAVGNSSPGLGGFGWGNQPRAGAIFEARFIAKIPVGYTLNYDSADVGSGAVSKWLTQTGGTGDWAEYRHQLACGTSGSFGDISFFYLTRDGSSNAYNEAVTWYLSSATVFDLSGYEDPITYIRLAPDEARIKAIQIILDGLVTINEYCQILLDGTIKAPRGLLGGWELEPGRIGVESSAGATSGSGLTLTDGFIKFANSNVWAAIGENVLPDIFGVIGVGRFVNKTPNPYDVNYGLLVDVSGGRVNLAMSGNGDVAMNGEVTGYALSVLTPPANQILRITPGSSPAMFNILARFVNSNSGLGFPLLEDVAAKLGMGSSPKPFSVRLTVTVSADSTTTGYIRGRNPDVSGMNTTQYPQKLDQNGNVDTAATNIAKGDVIEYQLVYDGSNYRAYLLNYRT